MSRRSLLLIIGLLATLLLLAVSLDALGVGGLPVLMRDDLPPATNSDVSFPPVFLRDLPRVVSALSAVAALTAYGLLLSAVAPQRLGTAVRALIGGPGQIVRLGLSGLLVAVVVVSTLLLGIASGIAGPVTPAFGFAFTIALSAGCTAAAMAAGRWLRSYVGAIEHEPTADLITGTTLFTIISLIPYIGIVAFGLLLCIGLGGLATTGLGAARHWKPTMVDY